MKFCAATLTLCCVVLIPLLSPPIGVLANVGEWSKSSGEIIAKIEKGTPTSGDIEHANLCMAEATKQQKKVKDLEANAKKEEEAAAGKEADKEQRVGKKGGAMKGILEAMAKKETEAVRAAAGKEAEQLISRAVEKANQLVEKAKGLQGNLSDLQKKLLDSQKNGIKREMVEHRITDPLGIAVDTCSKVIGLHREMLKVPSDSSAGQETTAKMAQMDSQLGYAGAITHLMGYLNSVSKLIGKEYNTFLIELELESINNEEWTVEKLDELEKALENYDNYEKTIEILEEKFRTITVKVSKLQEKLEQILKTGELGDNTFCSSEVIRRAWFRIAGRSSDQDPRDPDSFQKVREVQQIVVELLLDAKLDILKNEMDAKFALFMQPKPMIGGDALIRFSHKFVDEWKQIDAMIEQDHQWTTEGMKKVYRRDADELAARALKETTPFKRIGSRVIGLISSKYQKDIDRLKAKKDVQEMKKITASFLSDLNASLGISDRSTKIGEKQTIKQFVGDLQQTILQAYVVKEVDEVTKSVWTADLKVITAEYADELHEIAMQILGDAKKLITKRLNDLEEGHPIGTDKLKGEISANPRQLESKFVKVYGNFIMQFGIISGDAKEVQKSIGEEFNDKLWWLKQFDMEQEIVDGVGEKITGKQQQQKKAKNVSNEKRAE